MSDLNFTFPINELAAALAERLAPVFMVNHQPVTPQAEKYLTRKETADLLNVSLPTLNEYTKTGKITACRFGVRILYKQSEIEARLLKSTMGRAGHE